MPPRMCYLGMGNMGKAMSRNLASKAGLQHPLVLWSRTTANALSHSAETPHTEVVQSAEEAVQQSDIIWSCLSDDQAVVATFDSVLKGNVKGKLFVECSTISTETTTILASKLLAQGAEFVAMPVFGEPSMATAGTLTCVPAGESESVNKIKPYLVGVVGRAVIDYGGEAPEKASLLKLVGNIFILMMVETLAEGHVLAEKCGLGTQNLEKFVQTVFPGPFTIHSKHMTTGRYHTSAPVANITMAKQIAAHVLELAESCGTKLPAYEAIRKNIDVIEDSAGPAGDIGGLYGAVRVLSGLPYANS